MLFVECFAGGNGVVKMAVLVDAPSHSGFLVYLTGNGMLSHDHVLWDVWLGRVVDEKRFNLVSTGGIYT